MFRRLDHPHSQFFNRRAIASPGSLALPFKARNYLLEAKKIRGAVIQKTDERGVSLEASSRFRLAEGQLRKAAEGAFRELTDAEKEFFFAFYPLSIIRTAALAQAHALLTKSNPEISKNRITATKNNLTGFFAVLKGSKPMSIICSECGLDVFSDSGAMRFGSIGKGASFVLDKSSFLLALSKDSFNGVTPEMFYNRQFDAGIKLGYPFEAITAFVSGFDRSAMMLRMIEKDGVFQPWLFSSVFVAPLSQDGEIAGMEMLVEWHSALSDSVPAEAMGLLLLESKIQTIIRVAHAVEAQKAAMRKDRE